MRLRPTAHARAAIARALCEARAPSLSCPGRASVSEPKVGTSAYETEEWHQGDCCAWRGAQPNATRCRVSQDARPNRRLVREPCAARALALVSRPSERQRAKSRDPGAARQNRWTIEMSRRVALGPGSRFARPGHEVSARFRARTAAANFGQTNPRCKTATVVIAERGDDPCYGLIGGSGRYPGR